MTECTHSHRYGERTKGSRYKYRRKIIHWKREELLASVRNYIKTTVMKNKFKYTVTKEELAVLFKSEYGMMGWVLHQLNLEGLVDQKDRNQGHDCNRNRIHWGPQSGWAANSYFVHKEN